MEISVKKMLLKGGEKRERQHHFYLSVSPFLCFSHRNIRIWQELF